MITIKVKFRESTIKKKKGTIYYLLTRNKEYREITTPYKIHSHEWNDKRSLIAISNAEYQRRYELQLIENSIIRDIRHLQHILKTTLIPSSNFSKKFKVKAYYPYSARVSQMICISRTNPEPQNHI